MLSNEKPTGRLAHAGLDFLGGFENLRTMLSETSNDSTLEADCKEELVPVLQRLIELELLAPQAFELLLKVQPEAAIEILLRRYLGPDVDPDTRFGGFQFNLSLMLTDFADMLGSEALKRLVRTGNIAANKLQDARVKAAFAEALDLEDEEIDELFGV